MISLNDSRHDGEYFLRSPSSLAGNTTVGSFPFPPTRRFGLEPLPRPSVFAKSVSFHSLHNRDHLSPRKLSSYTAYGLSPRRRRLRLRSHPRTSHVSRSEHPSAKNGSIQNLQGCSARRQLVSGFGTFLVQHDDDDDPTTPGTLSLVFMVFTVCSLQRRTTWILARIVTNSLPSSLCLPFLRLLLVSHSTMYTSTFYVVAQQTIDDLIL